MILKKLFAPAQIGGLTLKNRIILPAMCTVFANEGGYVSEKLIHYHAARAKGGCGLNIVEIASVHPSPMYQKFWAYMMINIYRVWNNWPRQSRKRGEKLVCSCGMPADR